MVCGIFFLLGRDTWKEKPLFQLTFTEGKLENLEKQTNSVFRGPTKQR